MKSNPLWRCVAVAIATLSVICAGCAAQTAGQKQAAQGWTPAKQGVTHADFAKEVFAAQAKAMAARGASAAVMMPHTGKPAAQAAAAAARPASTH